MFAREYVIDLNGTRAAIAAGYSEKGAEVRASELLSRSKVRKLVDGLLAKRASRLELTAERIDEEIARCATANMLDYMEIDEDGKPIGLDLSKLTREQAAAIQEISEDATGGSGDGERKLIIRTKFKLTDKYKYLELACRLKGRLQEKLELTGDANLIDALTAGRKRLHGNGTSQQNPA